MTDEMTTSEPATEEPPLLHEGVDYYLEDSLMVFTSTFLLRRGFCCERGCRHCPYGYSKQDALGNES